MFKSNNSQLIKASKQNMTRHRQGRLICCCLLKPPSSDMDTKDEEYSTRSRGVGPFLPKPRMMNVYNCKKLKSLSNEMRKLTSLQELTICSCIALESFPNGDLPPNLIPLETWDCDNLDGHLSKWNLQSLAFLRDFSIADEECLLHTTLTSVWIGRLQNLESLSMQLQSLASLKELEIEYSFLPKEFWLVNEHKESENKPIRLLFPEVKQRIASLRNKRNNKALCFDFGYGRGVPARKYYDLVNAGVVNHLLIGEPRMPLSFNRKLGDFCKVWSPSATARAFHQQLHDYGGCEFTNLNTHTRSPFAMNSFSKGRTVEALSTQLKPPHGCQS
ncbi:hypothetical protein NC652_023120 [Populus alba x Populus x berolinensis]|nr:hypothetical protein NC652_023120 [Populus alba x Populus x berolinensis]